MIRRFNQVLLVSIFLLVSLVVCSFGFIKITSTSNLVAGTEQVTWNYYVVAGVETGSPSATPDSDPTGFHFAGSPSYFDWGTVPSDYQFMQDYASINITNVLASGQDIVIANLTAEVTAGTPTLPFVASGSPHTYGNITTIGFSSLDPIRDECNYHTGVVTQGGMPDLDEFYMATGTPYPPRMGDYCRDDSLVQPDENGDATLTNHTAPIYLANGASFTEYLGVVYAGNQTAGTQVTGTIMLTFTYRKVCLPNSVDVLDVSLVDGSYPGWPMYFEVTVKNLGATPLTIDVTVRTFKEATFLGDPILHNWTDSDYVDTGTGTAASLGAGSTTALTVNWNLRADKPYGDLSTKAIGLYLTGTGAGGCDHYDETEEIYLIKAPGDVNGDRVIDSTDLGGLGLSWGKTPPDILYNKQADFNLDNVVDSTDLGGMGINWGKTY